MAEHTPGPWQARPTEIGGRIARIEIVHRLDRGMMEKPIALMRSGFTCFEEDARLIAAAPDLLDVIERLIAITDGCFDDDGELYRDAKAAIAKARGEG